MQNVAMHSSVAAASKDSEEDLRSTELKQPCWYVVQDVLTVQIASLTHGALPEVYGQTSLYNAHNTPLIVNM